MRIGLTYDLRADHLAAGLDEEKTAEFDSAVTIEGIAAALGEPDAAGPGTGTASIVCVGRLQALAERLVAGERFDLVFNIAEGVHGVAREAQVPALLDAYGIPYTFSDPMVLALTLHKAMTKRVVRDCHIPTAPFVLIEDPAAARAVDLPPPLFAKPNSEGSGIGIGPVSRIERREQIEPVCRHLLERFAQPVLLETYLPGREFTVGLLGTGARAEVLGVMEVLLGDKAEAGIYSYANKEEYEERVSYRLVTDEEARAAGAVALAAWRALGCRDGGRIDIRSDAAGRPNFVEVNPLAGLNPERSDLVILARLTGLSYPALIRRILASALERCGTAPRADGRSAAE